jgi:hypothetical protein
LGQVLGTLFNVHSPQANANGARGDDDDSVAIFPQLVGRVHNEGQYGQQGLMGIFIDD